jgi:hypothetical protein
LVTLSLRPATPIQLITCVTFVMHNCVTHKRVTELAAVEDGRTACYCHEPVSERAETGPSSPYNGAVSAGPSELVDRFRPLGAPAAFVAGAVALAGVLAATIVARATGTSGTPYIPRGDWRPTWWVGVIVAFTAYAVAVLFLSLAPAASRRAAFALAVAIQAIPLATPMIFSGDTVAYTQMAKSPHPYGEGQSVYGPLWTAISRVVADISHPVYVHRLLACASVLAITAMVSRLARRRALATAFVGWNPLIAFHFSSAGHNDALMTALAVGGMTLAAAGRTEPAGATWIASFFIKFTTAPIYLLWAIERRRRGVAIGVAGAVAAAAAILGLSYRLYGWSWIDAFSNLHHVERQPGSFFWAWIRDATGISYAHERTVSYVVEIAAFGFFVYQAWRSRLRLGLAAGVLTLAAPHINAWYLILPVALAAADDEDRWGKALAVVLCGVMFMDVLSGLPA